MEESNVNIDRFEALVEKLDGDEWLECDLSSFTLKDFKDFGVHVRTHNTPIILLNRFAALMKRAKVEKEAQKAYANELDLPALGRRANKEPGIATIEAFLKLVTQLGLEDKARKSFCKKLDLTLLGRQARKDEVGIATIVSFLWLLKRADIGKGAQRAFINELDLPSLTRQATTNQVGLATIVRFFRLLIQVDVSRNFQKELYDKLDLSALGRQTDKDEMGISTLVGFLRLLAQANVDANGIKAFVSSIDWREMGQRSLNENKTLKRPLVTFNYLLNTEVITKEMCREFVEGIGWDNLRIASESFPPDVMAALKLLLTNKKCNYDKEKLAERGLTWSREEWLHAFISNAFSDIDNKRAWRKGLLKYALSGLLHTDITPLLLRDEITLKGWNILTHNLAFIDIRAVADTVTPVLSQLSPSQLETLFCRSDLKNIGIFLNHFSPQGGLFQWELSNDIDFTKINFTQKLTESSLHEIAHFISSFFRVGRADCAHYFASELDKYPEELVRKIQKANLSEIDFFVWNWCTTMPEGKKPVLITDAKFRNEVFRKIGGAEAQQEFLLGIIGTLHLSEYSIPQLFLNVIDVARAKRDCQRVSGTRDVRMFRMLAGLFAVSDDVLSPKEKRAYLLTVRKCEENLQLKIPMEEIFISRLKTWLYA